MRNSTIPLAGKGLFARKPFAQGQLVGVYGGVRGNRTNKNGYIFEDGWGTIDAAPVSEEFPDQRSMGRINDWYWDLDKANVEFSRHCQGLVVATKKISCGDELFMSYGPTYWDDKKVDYLRLLLPVLRRRRLK
jgi:hypothetical protein